MSHSESALIEFLLSGVGEEEEAEESLLALCEAGNPLSRQVVHALTVSPSERLDEVVNVMYSEGGPKLPPNDASKQVLETLARRGDEMLMVSVGLAFMWSFEKWYDQYLPYLEELILTSDEATYRALLGLAIGLEHLERFVREDAARWLAPDKPRLWPLIWRMYLATGMRHLKEFVPLLELARTHPDREVREWGEAETSILEEEETEAPADFERIAEALSSSQRVNPEQLRAIKQLFDILKDQEGGVPADFQMFAEVLLSSQSRDPERSRAIDQLLQSMRDRLSSLSKEKDRGDSPEKGG